MTAKPKKKPTPPWLVALRKLPRDYYLQICIEPPEADTANEEQFVAELFQRAPEDGWPSRAAYFRHPPGSPSEQQSAHPWEHDDSIVWAINPMLSDASHFEQLLNSAMRHSIEHLKTRGRP